mgnify:CR=1 FL=1
MQVVPKYLPYSTVTPGSGATGSSYTINSVSAADNGAQFRVVVSNGSGGATTTIYPTSTPEDVHHILTDSGSRFLVAENEKQLDKASANARYERLFDQRAFWFGEVAYLRDPFKDISYLISPLAGAGIHVINTDTRKLTFDGASC